MPTVSEIHSMMVQGFIPEKAEGINAVIQFDLSGDNAGQFYLVVENGTVEAHEGLSENPKMTLKAATEDYYNVATGKTNAMQAFMTGKIKITGDMSLAMKMQSMFKTS
ncbi:MAG: SCP2 sterol-binding domain-containing protein [Phototrophicales bacterium]|nr:SCP2 sterol-binding domain-containing protein [Phototrophicales bacterium]